MGPLLLFFKDNYLELWSIDKNGRLIPVLYQTSNKIPLYFLLNGEEIIMSDYARDSYCSEVKGSYGDFWVNTGNKSLFYTRFHTEYSFDTLLPYALKENILPTISKSQFHISNFSEFLQQKITYILYDSFIEEDQRDIINKGFFEIVGFLPNNLTILDFWNLFKTAVNVQEGSYIFLNASLDNIYIHLISKNQPYHISKKIIEGKGRDPRVDVLLDFVAEKAIARGSFMKSIEIKKELAREGEILLSLLKNGLVIYTISNNKIGVSPLKLNFHRSEVDGRLNNRQSLNYLQNEFDNFRKNNNASELKIYLYGEILNQEVFLDFFKSTYANVVTQNNDFDDLFLKHTLNMCLSQVVSDQNNVSPNVLKHPVSGPSITDTVRSTAPPPLPNGSRPVSAPPLPVPGRPVAPPPIPGASRPPLPPQTPGNSRPVAQPPIPGVSRPATPPPLPTGTRTPVPPIVPPMNGNKKTTKPSDSSTSKKGAIPPPPPPPPPPRKK
jgi:hypothetical protein